MRWGRVEPVSVRERVAAGSGTWGCGGLQAWDAVARDAVDPSHYPIWVGLAWASPVAKEYKPPSPPRQKAQQENRGPGCRSRYDP